MIIDCQECRNKKCFGCPVNIQHNQMHLKKSIADRNNEPIWYDTEDRDIILQGFGVDIPTLLQIMESKGVWDENYHES